MVVKIQTVDGKIRAYQTVYGIGSGDSGPEKYVTECGMEWKNKPSPSEECDHIGCAITPAKSGADSGPMGFMVCLALAIVFLVFLSGKDIPPLEFLGFKFIGFEFLGLKFPAWTLISFGFFAFSAILSLKSGLDSGARFDELKEFERERKIRGIRAWRVYDSETGTFDVFD